MAEEAETRACRLLALPPELRNRVYEYVLIKSNGERIEVTTIGHERPSLLRTCKQIHVEGLKIFYYLNTFHLRIHDYDCSTLARWGDTITDTLGLHRRKTEFHSSTYHVSPSWTNLLTWLQLHHSGRAWHTPKSPNSLLARQEPSAGKYVIGGMFALAKRLQGQRWQFVKTIMEDSRSTLIHFDARWGND